MQTKAVKSGHKYLLITVIVEIGIGSRVLDEAKKVGVTGGTILLGKGTVQNPILKALGLDETKKEIVLMIMPGTLADTVHDHLAETFKMKRPNHGIIITMPVKNVFGLHDLTKQDSGKGERDMSYEVIYTIVEKGLGQRAADAALKAGSTGATIINARGSGIHENIKFFAMNIEPEKEIVMVIIEASKAGAVADAIRAAMDIDDPGKGILFTLGANRVTGLRN